jgi:Glycosyl transferase family 2
MEKLAPIALFVYNRPNHTRQTIEALQLNSEAKNSDLYIFSDAAKNEAAKTAVNEVRDYIKQVSGFRKVNIVERDSNWGLANSVIDGVTHLCNEFGKVVVLEDDLVVSPHFLEFMNSGLAKYEFDEKVMQIAGYMFPINLKTSEDAFFMPLTSSWGWATWKRAWQHFDPSAKGYELLVKNSTLKRSFDIDAKYPYFKMLESQINNKVDSWAIRWYLSVFLLNGLVLYPRESLVENFGFDGSGVNCIASGFTNTPIDMGFSVKTMPTAIQLSDTYRLVFQQIPKPKLSYKNYFKRLLKALKV